MDPIGKTMSTGQIATMLGIDSHTAAKLIDSGLIPGWRVCNHRRALESSVIAYGVKIGVPLSSKVMGRTKVVMGGLTSLARCRLMNAFGQSSMGNLIDAGGSILQLGAMIDRHQPAIIVVSGGQIEMLSSVVRELGGVEGRMLIVFDPPEDSDADWISLGANVVIRGDVYHLCEAIAPTVNSTLSDT